MGEPGHIQRVAGKRSSGSSDTQKWLISKDDAHVEHGRLIPDTAGAKKAIRSLGAQPVHVKGDVFSATSRRNVPEHEKPTAAQRRARRSNIRNAQAARHMRSA
jgi:hypothetical protein